MHEIETEIETETEILHETEPTDMLLTDLRVDAWHVLTRPLPLFLEERGYTYIVSEQKFLFTAQGTTLRQAVTTFKQAMLQEYVFLENHRHELSPSMETQRAYYADLFHYQPQP